MSIRHALLGRYKSKKHSELGAAMIELLLIASITLVAVWLPLEQTIKSFSGDQIDAQELLTAYSSFNGQSFEVTNLGPDGLLRMNDSDVDNILRQLASDLENLTGVPRFCAALLSGVPGGGVTTELAVRETSDGCTVTPNQEIAFAESLDPLGGLQFAVTVNNESVFPDISAQYRASDAPNNDQY